MTEKGFDRDAPPGLTRIISLVDAIAAKLEVGEARGPELDELKQDTVPDRVLEEMTRAPAG